MNITTSQAIVIHVGEIKSQEERAERSHPDAINVMLESTGEASGRITVQTYQGAWSAYFSACGKRGIVEFCAGLEECYLSDKLAAPDDLGKGKRMQLLKRIAHDAIIIVKTYLEQQTAGGNIHGYSMDTR